MRVVFVADLHVGSRVGLCFPTVPLAAGGSYSANPVQRALYARWEAQAAKGDWKQPDFLVVNGDAVDGVGVKKRGVEQWTTDLLSQVAVARDLLAMWEAKHIYVMRGSPYHVTAGGQPVEELLAQELQAEPFPPECKAACRSGLSLYLTVEDVTFHIAHRAGSGSNVWQYRATPITREMLLSKLNDEIRAEMDGHKVDVVVRAHAHHFWRSESMSHVGLMLPAWQAKSPFMEERNVLGFVPDIGFVGVQIKGEKYAISKVFYKLAGIQRPPHAVYPAGKSASRVGRRARA